MYNFAKKQRWTLENPNPDHQGVRCQKEAARIYGRRYPCEHMPW